MGAKGYAFALISCPLITSLFFIKQLNIKIRKSNHLTVTNFSFWRYGVFGGLTNVATQLLFLIDLILIGTLMNDSEMVTNFRYISIIPFSLLFLPRAFIATDFVTFTENIYNKKLYKKVYQKLHATICDHKLCNMFNELFFNRAYLITIWKRIFGILR